MQIRSLDPTAAELLLLGGIGIAAAVALAELCSLSAGVTMAVSWALVIVGAGVAAWRWGRDRDLRAADRITLARGFATCIVAAGAVSAPELSPQTLWFLTGLAAAALLTDGIDGYVARRNGAVSEFGARMDREIDAFTVLVLAILVYRLGRADAWILAAGGMRYAFVAASALWPWLRAQLPPSKRRQAVCVIQVASLVVCVPPLLPPVWAVTVLAAALAALTLSFSRDVTILRAGRFGRASDAADPAASAASLP